jgi:hypothetical protein
MAQIYVNPFSSLANAPGTIWTNIQPRGLPIITARLLLAKQINFKCLNVRFLQGVKLLLMLLANMKRSWDLHVNGLAHSDDALRLN